MSSNIGQWVILLIVCVAIIAALIYIFVTKLLPCQRSNIVYTRNFGTYLANKGMYYSTSTGCVAAQNDEAIKWTIHNTSSKSIMMGIVSGDSSTSCSNNTVVSNIVDTNERDGWIKTFGNESSTGVSVYRALYPRCTASFYIANSPDNYTLSKDVVLESTDEDIQFNPGSTIHFTVVDNDNDIDVTYTIEKS